jgi:hypothetical protein
MVPSIVANATAQTKPCTVDENRIIRTLSDKESFYFYKDEGYPIEQKAVSLQDFASKIEQIESQSLFFHYYRGDFERWVRECIGDSFLASKLRSGETIMQEENLRKYITKQVRARLCQICGVSLEFTVKVG